MSSDGFILSSSLIFLATSAAYGNFRALATAATYHRIF